MELMQRVQNFKRNLDQADDPTIPWYRRKKTLVIGGIAVVMLVGVLVLFFGGYFAGMSAKNGEPQRNSVPDAEARALPPLEWAGMCPKGSTTCPTSFQQFPPPLILVSLDALHPEFLNRGFSPTIKKISNCGTHAPYMLPVFPSKTFPNHFSQVTGLYPSSHGIVDNNMYDPSTRKLFKVGTPESLQPYWWLKEPIWVTAEKQGKKTACFYWPGSEVKINGTTPTYYKKYNARIPFASRVDQVLAWLDLPPSSRPHLITLYVNEPDHTLHEHGTRAKQVDNALSKVDDMIERLFSGLQQRNLVNCVNVIIVSDHGMSDIDCKRSIDLRNFINVNDTYNMVGPFARIRPKGRRNETVINDFVAKLKCKNDHMRVYAKEQLPVRMHYADNHRIVPIFLDLDAGWTAVSKGPSKQNDYICTGGAHGYDNLFPDMRASFIAHGPSFKHNFTMEPFKNTELYEMLTELINISPNPNNGTRGSLHYIMTQPQTLPPQKEPESPPIANVPSDENVYDERVSASHCCQQTQKQVQVQDVNIIRDLHLPFGIPYSVEDQNSVQLLYNENYVSAFSENLQIALWSSFTLREKNNYDKVSIDCWTGDARIPSDITPKCDDFRHQDVLQGPLYPPGFSNPSNGDSTLITNSIPKSLNHSNIVEEPFNHMLTRWLAESGELNVVVGPAFDIFAAGIRPSSQDLMRIKESRGPLLIPTHVFAVTTWCTVKSSSLKSCDPSNLQTNAFLLQNQPFPVNCELPEDFIAKNIARVVDVEKLTGISFYTGLPIYNAIRLRTMMPERPVKERLRKRYLRHHKSRAHA